MADEDNKKNKTIGEILKGESLTIDEAYNLKKLAEVINNSALGNILKQQESLSKMFPQSIADILKRVEAPKIEFGPAHSAASMLRNANLEKARREMEANSRQIEQKNLIGAQVDLLSQILVKEEETMENVKGLLQYTQERDLKQAASERLTQRLTFFTFVLTCVGVLTALAQLFSGPPRVNVTSQIDPNSIAPILKILEKKIDDDHKLFESIMDRLKTESNGKTKAVAPQSPRGP